MTGRIGSRGRLTIAQTRALTREVFWDEQYQGSLKVDASVQAQIDTINSRLDDVEADLLTVNVPPRYTQSITKFGRAADVDTADTPMDVRGYSGKGAMTWPSSAAVATIVSTSANDAAAGTGARTVTVYGVDSSYDEISETVNMNGTSNVNTVNSYLHIDRLRVITVGSGGVNEGEITATIGGSVVCDMPAGNGQSTTTHIIVPNSEVSGEVPFLVNCRCRMGRNATAYAEVELVTQKPGESERVIIDDVVSQGGPLDFDFDQSLDENNLLSPGTRVWWRVEDVSANNTFISGRFSIVWLPDTT